MTKKIILLLLPIFFSFPAFTQDPNALDFLESLQETGASRDDDDDNAAAAAAAATDDNDDDDDDNDDDDDHDMCACVLALARVRVCVYMRACVRGCAQINVCLPYALLRMQLRVQFP